MPTVPIRLPHLDDEVTHAIISKWHVNEGDRVHRGDGMVELATDLALFCVSVPQPGIIVEILADSGDAVECGAILLMLEPETQS